MTEVATTPLQREEDALRSIQNALALSAVTKRSQSHGTICTARTVSTSSSWSRSLQSDQGSCDDSSDNPDSSEQTIDGLYMEQAVINSIAETLLSGQEDEPVHDRAETALEIRRDGISYISDLSHTVEDEAAPGGSLLSHMLLTCMGGSVFSTSIEPQSTQQDTMKSMSVSGCNRLFCDSQSTMDNSLGFCGTQREPPSTGGLATRSLSKSVALARRRRPSSQGQWHKRFLKILDKDDASRWTDKTEKHCNTSNEKKLKMASRRRSGTSNKTP